ncbi:hypothetical protein LAZ67_19001448 [Cordylochernes scorpioides]|uniref:Uncharacterized protein n=1 Tax=Cordylochernes scorpioides TaxID=51811 RepID=A0ABY6LHR0_9ARAC|nr:hypothetical protein LAZ67_19001448 [Cordylochernes scorpioides]
MRPNASSPKPSGQLRRITKESVTLVRNTRQQQALNKARSAAASFDQCCYVEWCADFHPVHYMKALEELLGKESVYQLMKMSGHVMVGLASIEKAERLVENGLTINNTFLRAFPYRRKAEKIILGNLPIAVKEEDIIEALRPYCRVISLAYEVVSCNGYPWTTGNREAFVLLNEGRKLHQLPAKLVIISKGESTPAYITYGPTPFNKSALTTPPAELSAPFKQTPSTSSSPAAPASVANFPVHPYETPAPELPAPAPSTSQLPSRPEPSSTNTEPSAAPEEENQDMTDQGDKRRCDTAEEKSTAAGSEQARSAAASFDQCCYIEYCADFSPVQYIKALEIMLGKDAVFQLMKMSGQVMVGLANVDLANRLVEEGLTIGTTFLRAFPYRQRPEKIVVGNLPLAIKDEDVIAALRPYCRVVSLTNEVVASGGYTWTTGNREVFILLKNGMKLHQLPTKLVIVSKGKSTPAYITYGLRGSKCHRQGHRRATCPLGISGERHQDTRQSPVSRFPSSKPIPFNKSALSTPPAELSAPFKQAPSTSSSPAAPASGANFPVRPFETPVPELPAPAPSTSQLPSRPEPSSTNTEPSAASEEENQTMTDQVENMFIELNAGSILAPLYDEVDDDEVVAAVIHRSDREALPDALSYENRKILYEFLGDAIEHVGDQNPSISTGLSELRVALNI